MIVKIGKFGHSEKVTKNLKNLHFILVWLVNIKLCGSLFQSCYYFCKYSTNYICFSGLLEQSVVGVAVFAPWWQLRWTTMNLDTTQKEFWTLLVYCQDKSCLILQLKSKVLLVSSFIQVLIHPLIWITLQSCCTGEAKLF